MAVFGGSGGYSTVSSQLHIVHSYEYHHTKGTPWNSLINAASQTFKTSASTHLTRSKYKIAVQGVTAQVLSKLQASFRNISLDKSRFLYL